MNEEAIEYNYEYLKKYFDSIHSRKIILSQIEIFKLLEIYRNKYFDFKNQIQDIDLARRIFNTFYLEVRIFAANYIYDGNYKYANNLYKKFETIVDFANINKLMKYSSWVEYSYNLSFMLYHSNEDFEAINRCDSITSEYIMKKMRIKNYNRIISEEDKYEEAQKAYERYFEYMILFSKLAQLICSKVGTNDISGKFYFRQKLFEEKLLYKFIELPYVYQMVTERLYVSIGDSHQHVVLDEREGIKGYKRKWINCKRFCKALRYTFFRKIAGSGEKPFNILKSSLIIVVLWAMIYSFVETASFSNFINYFYQSFFIFTTFGLFNDSILLNSTNKIWMSVEIALGIIFINGFIVILARKLLR